MEEPQQQQKAKEPQITLKDPKKVEAGKRLAEWNRKNKKKIPNAEQQRQQEQQQERVIQDGGESITQVYGIGVGVIAVALIGVAAYKFWGGKSKEVSKSSMASSHAPANASSSQERVRATHPSAERTVTSSKRIAEDKFELK